MANWERQAKLKKLRKDDFVYRRDRIAKSLDPSFGVGSTPVVVSHLGNVRPVRLVVENPTFSHSHAIYNDGTGPKLYKVVEVTQIKGLGPSSEVVTLQHPVTGLLLKPVASRVLIGTRVISKAK